MFKRKNKKTGCETPEFRKSLPAEEFTTSRPRSVRRFLVDTEEKLDTFTVKYPDAQKIEGAVVYWSDKHQVLGVVTSQEWKDCLFGGGPLPGLEEEVPK